MWPVAPLNALLLGMVALDATVVGYRHTDVGRGERLGFAVAVAALPLVGPVRSP